MTELRHRAERAAFTLEGARVAVTRPAPGANALAERLLAAGAIPLVLPLVRIGPPADEGTLLAMAAGLASYDWIVFTSVNAVERLIDAVHAARLPTHSDQPAGGTNLRAAVVGSVTAAAAAAAGFCVDAVAEGQVGSGIAGAMAAVEPLQGRRILWPRAAGARPDLAVALRAAGAHVDDVEAYRTVPDPDAAAALAALEASGEVDVLTFTSPSAVDAYRQAGGGVQPRTVVAVIGPVTAGAARRAGLPVHVQPADHTMDALVQALEAFFEQSRASSAGT